MVAVPWEKTMVPKITRTLIDQAWQDVCSRARKLPEFNTLSRTTYSTPAGYSPYRQVAVRIGANILNGKEFSWAQLQQDFALLITTITSTAIAQDASPVYWIKSDLMQALDATTIQDKVLEHLHRALPHGIFLLPQGIVTPDGQPVDYLAFMHNLAHEERSPLILGSNQVHFSVEPNPHIVWHTTTAGGTIYAGNIGIDTELGIINWGTTNESPPFQILGEQPEPAAITHAFTSRLGNLLLQILLFLQIYPDALETGVPTIAAGTGFGKSSAGNRGGQKIISSPNWIGNRYQPKTEIARSSSKGGTHASPRTHWRRGTWRRVAVGPRSENNRKWHWFEPVLVNPWHSNESKIS